MARVLFGLSLILNLIEIVVFYCYKVTGSNIELDAKQVQPRTSHQMVTCFGFISIILAAIAITIGLSSFDEQKCLERWFVDDDVLCKNCTLYFGAECLDCTSSAKCDNCTTGYFFASEDDETKGIVAATEIRCRPCQEFWGQYCLECTQQACTKSKENEAFIDVESGTVVECTSIPNCADASCDPNGCSACVAGFYLNEARECVACSDTLEYCDTCSSATTCTSCSNPTMAVGEAGTCICDATQ